MGYEIQLAGIPQLAGLLEQYGPETVWRAAWEVLQFHPSLINTLAEATAIAEHLAATEKGSNDET